MERVHDREADPVELDRSAFVGAGDLAHVCALVAQPALQLDERHDLGRELLRDLDGAADMVGMAMGDGDDVGPFRFLLVLGALRVVEPRIDVDPLAAGTVDSKRCVAEPSDGNVRHSPPPR